MTIYKTPYDNGMCFVTIATAVGAKFAGQPFSSNTNANAAIRLVQKVLRKCHMDEAEVVTNELKPTPQVDWNDF